MLYEGSWLKSLKSQISFLINAILLLLSKTFGPPVTIITTFNVTMLTNIQTEHMSLAPGSTVASLILNWCIISINVVSPKSSRATPLALPCHSHSCPAFLPSFPYHFPSLCFSPVRLLHSRATVRQKRGPAGLRGTSSPIRPAGLRPPWGSNTGYLHPSIPPLCPASHSQLCPQGAGDGRESLGPELAMEKPGWVVYL